MLSAEKVQAIKNSPEFLELTRTRNKFARILTVTMLVIYYGFILVLAFAPGFFGTPLSSGTVITVGIPIGATVIVLAFVLTGIYTKRANSEFDDLTQKIKDEVRIK